MRILVVKLSSLGDVIHTLPAITEAKQLCKTLKIDWLVEPAFAEIPTAHPAVDQVYALPLRQLKKNLFSFCAYQNVFDVLRQVRAKQYDWVIDPQGLLKSALITRIMQGSRSGYDKSSIREPVASFFYQHTHHISQQQHAVSRIRALFAATLGYTVDLTQKVSYGLSLSAAWNKGEQSAITDNHPYCLFFHGTTWDNKLWPVENWIVLARYFIKKSVKIVLPYGNQVEKKRAESIAAAVPGVKILPPVSLIQLMHYIVNAKGIVSVDTGLGHLAAALNTPNVGLYGPTHPGLSGPWGQNQLSIEASAKIKCAPCLKRVCALSQQICFDEITPKKVMEKLELLMAYRTQ